MEAFGQQKQLLDEHIATLFQQWQQQLGEEIKRCDKLQEEVETLQKDLEAKNGTISRLTDENAHLKEDVARSQLMSGSDDSPRLKALIEKHNSLYREHELLKSTAAADQQNLIARLRKEREKLRKWNRFSSPDPRSAHSPLTVAAPTCPNCADPLEKSAARVDLSENEDYAGCPSVTQGCGSQHKSERVLAGGGHRASESKNGQRVYNSQGTVDAPQKHAALPKESNAMEQPEKAQETDSSFVDSHLLHASRVSSPELPSIPGKSRSLTAFNRQMSTDADQAALQESLPQVQRSDSTAPPSEVLPTIDTSEASADHGSGSDTPQFLGARSVNKKVQRGVPSTSRRFEGSVTEPVTIKSDPDISFATSRSPPRNSLALSIHESLDPSTSICEQTVPRKERLHCLQHPLPSDAALREGPDEMQNVTRRTSSGKSTPLHGQMPNGQSQIDNNAQKTAPLKSIDGNAQRLPRTVKKSVGLKTKKRRSSDSRGVEAIPTISEDGEEFVKRARKAPIDYTSSPRPTNRSTRLRLDNLLTEPLDEKAPLTLASKQDIADIEQCLLAASVLSTPKGKRSYKALMQAEDKNWAWWDEAKDSLESKHMKSPSMPFWHPTKSHHERSPIMQIHGTPKPARKSDSRIESTSVSRTGLTAKPTPRSDSNTSKTKCVSNAHQPYRTLPLSSLSLSHFKINPRANHNLTYAYTDVVRNQSERKCLPGCTRSECCGRKFAALAQTLPLQWQPHARVKQPPTTMTNESTTAPNPAFSAAPTNTDEIALQAYLGNHYHALTPQERAIHLAAAQTQHLANKYGKVHRHLYQRAPSPPGFWNVDFPATQEREKERKVADEMERAEVQRRWRESMKNVDLRETEGGEPQEVLGTRKDKNMGAGEMGLWMFADE